MLPFFTNLEPILQRCPALADGSRISKLDETRTLAVPEKL
jgi:hypothetical protein